MHKVVSCTGYGDRLQNTPLLTRKHWNISKSYILKLFCPAVSNGLRAWFAIVAAPSDTDWSLEWHDILHNFFIQVQDSASAAAITPWSRIVCKQHWDLFCYVAHLPEHRWVRRMLAWNPAVRTRQVGRPRHTRDQKVKAFCCYKQLGHWLDCARDEVAWLALSHSFYTFCMSWGAAICQNRFVNVVFFWFTACAQNGPATRRPDIDIDIFPCGRRNPCGGIILPRAVNMYSAQFCPWFRSKTFKIRPSFVTSVFGSCASFVSMAVLSTFNRKPTLVTGFTNFSKVCATSGPKFGNNRLSSA